MGGVWHMLARNLNTDQAKALTQPQDEVGPGLSGVLLWRGYLKNVNADGRGIAGASRNTAEQLLVGD